MVWRPCRHTLISPFRRERALARQLVGPDEFLEVFVDAPIEECQRIHDVENPVGQGLDVVDVRLQMEVGSLRRLVG
jgi:hypothetical protein